MCKTELTETRYHVVAIKQLDKKGLQGNREFLVEVLMLSLLHNKILVNLIGYCTDGDQRILVYKYMLLGWKITFLVCPLSVKFISRQYYLSIKLSYAELTVEFTNFFFSDLPLNKKPLDWSTTRMKIPGGATKGLEYLHDTANPPVIYRDFKASNILLDEEFNLKLSDFGLAKLGPTGDKSYVSTRVMGTYDYCAHEYALTSQLTMRSDIYSFGVVFLVIITGLRAIDNTRRPSEQNLVT
ncbi:hypothetical protein GIB67_031575 [Kingdonia uniflora]|uniref:Protein kinase domain-containing protein n=1 Tax=Kingdonia uniflora TaxID=39325 RepID=A0A7J7PCA3_9MAGN|nr:hypothetical protein GIB67_031575 [Kingdonia uniflora]